MNFWLMVVGCLGLGGCSVLPRFEPVHPAEAIVVLGNRPPVNAFGEVRPETRRRVEAGVELYKKAMAPLVVMTGGKSGGFVEAEVMRDLAIRLGTPAQAVLVETESLSTITNARNTIRLLRRRFRRSECSVIVVSSPYHLARARQLFECAGAKVQIHPSKIPPSVGYRVGFTMYEWIIRGIYLFFDPCKRARGRSDRTNYSGLL